MQISFSNSMNYDFWTEWENTTDLERRMISTLIEARKRVIQAVPAQALYAIYVKGSFVRRELSENSDIDIVPIVTTDQYQGAVFAVNGPDISPACAIPLSLEEFADNSLHTEGISTPDVRAEPDLFLHRLNRHALIYGQALDPKHYPMRTAQQIVQDEKHKILEGYIPLYQKGALDLSSVLKEVFWLCEWELEAQGKQVPHSFAGILSSSDKDHPVHYAQEIRSGNNSDVDEFLSRLKDYLTE